MSVDLNILRRPTSSESRPRPGSLGCRTGSKPRCGEDRGAVVAQFGGRIGNQPDRYDVERGVRAMVISRAVACGSVASGSSENRAESERNGSPRNLTTRKVRPIRGSEPVRYRFEPGHRAFERLTQADVLVAGRGEPQ